MDWDHIYSNLKSLANRAAVKINQTADIATLQFRVSMAGKRLEEAYGALGHVSYEHFTGDSDLSERVAKAVSGVNDAMIALRLAEAELAEAKKRAEASDGNTEPATSKTREENQTSEAEKTVEQTAGQNVNAHAEPFAPVASETAVSSYSDAEDTVEIAVEETL